jgi:hypothetical protein
VCPRPSASRRSPTVGQYQATGRVTWQVTPRNTFGFFAQASENCTCPFAVGRTGATSTVRCGRCEKNRSRVRSQGPGYRLSRVGAGKAIGR